MRVGCIIQARPGSTRLPNKINADIGGRPMLWHVIRRMMRITHGWELPDPLVAKPDDYPEVHENDVLGRYILCARRNALDAIMRVTGDCPLIDPNACQRVLERFLHGFDYCANDLYGTYPDGFGCEVMTREVLEYMHRHVSDKNPADREHVTPFVVRSVLKNPGSPFYGSNVRCPVIGVSHLKFSVDTQEDLDRVRAIDFELGRPEQQIKGVGLEATLEAWERVKINSPVAA